MVRSAVMTPTFSFIDEFIQRNGWQFLYSYANIAYHRLVRDFYTEMEIVQIEGVPVLQTVIHGVPIQPTLPGVPYPDSMEPPSMDELAQFLDP